MTNPLHTPLGNLPLSNHSALCGAVEVSSANRTMLPWNPYVPTKRKTTTTTSSASALENLVVEFDYPGSKGQGVSMRDMNIHGGFPDRVDKFDEIVLRGTNSKKITLKIIWPGYDYIDWTRAIEINDTTTRYNLGAVVSANYARFLEKARASPLPSTSGEVNSVIAPGALRLENVVLIKLVNVWEDVWQADVAIQRSS